MKNKIILVASAFFLGFSALSQTYTFSVGDKYVGEYMNGKKHGQGTYTYANGKIEKGLWKNDEFVGE